MNKYLFIVLLVFCGIQDCFTQTQKIQFVIVDHNSRLPISDVHVFINNASFGDITDKYGHILISFPSLVRGELIISHIAYDTKVIRYNDYFKWSKNDTIELISSSIDISFIEVKSTRNRKWKRNYKKFKLAFLGDDQAARNCTILNPEVLRFYNEQEDFRTEAVDRIIIKNDYLKYEISFVLDDLTVKSDGSITYNGYAHYKNLAAKLVTKKLRERRKYAYSSSSRSFFKSLVDKRFDDKRYKLNILKYRLGKFEFQFETRPDKLIKYDSLNYVYTMEYTDYLQIIDHSNKLLVETNIGVQAYGLESEKFGGMQRGSSKIEYATSMLYKIAKVLYLDKNGILLNPKDVQEFGYWAKQRMSQSLPIEYGVKYSEDDKIAAIPSNEIHSLPDLELFKALIYSKGLKKEKAIESIQQNWKNAYFAPLLDVVFLSTDKKLVKTILEILRFKSNQAITDYYSGLQWLWKKQYSPSPDYADFKAEIYQYIDPHFRTYFFDRNNQALIKLDEVIWGGVKQDGIPPLRFPKLLEASKANYMSDKELVFGIKIGDEAIAYPKRILSWHEFVVDSIDGKTIASVYCTLCGMVIAYDMSYDEVKYDLGTSGFLYRSNKLMYDKKTNSLWSTIEGKPVIGPLVGKNIKLKNHPIVTTTWGEWKVSNPHTKVLSEDTGYDRNYKIGSAYKSYYATDELMFPVPKFDNRLANKEEVFVLKSKDFHKEPVAISLKYLKRHPFLIIAINNVDVIIITNNYGASRAYLWNGVSKFKFKKGQLMDAKGQTWTMSEDALISPSGTKMNRVNSHNIFWFAWYNVFPNTRLIK